MLELVVVVGTAMVVRVKCVCEWTQLELFASEA